MKKVLVIAYHLPPSRKVGALRTKGLAKYLPEFGWEPIILTGLLPREPDPSFRVVENHLPYQKWLRVLTTPSWRARIEKVGVQPTPSFLQKVYSFFRGLVDIPDSRIGWLPFAVASGRKIITEERIEAMISIFGPATCHLVAHRLKREFPHLFWLADFRDPWTQYRPKSVRTGLERRLEIKTLKDADVLSIVSDPLAQDLQKLHPGKKVYAISNGFDPEEMAEKPTLPLTKKFTIRYTGSLSRRNGSLESFLSSLARMMRKGLVEKEDLKVELVGAEERLARPSISKYGLSGFVVCLPFQEREKVLNCQRKSQILLFLEPEGPGMKGCFTAKIFEYLAAGRPILAIGSPQSVVADLLRQTRTGILCSTTEEIGETLTGYYQEWQKSGKVTYTGVREEIMKYSHREMAKRFATILEERF